MMISGVSFDGRHCFDDYGMILASKDIGQPEVQTNYIQVPGRDGSLDLTESLSGEVHYNDRTISLTFVSNDVISSKTWAEMLSDVANNLHGRRVKIVFDDDPDYYYDGRCAINAYATEKGKRTITIDCTCDPYKYTESGEKSL